MNKLKKIAYNCHKATFLIEKKQAGHITLREDLELRYHLSGCSVCRVFQQQSILINKMVKDYLSPAKEDELKLDESYKDKLKSGIEDALNKRP